MEIKVVAKKWGSSLGVIIPKEVVDLKHIKENDEFTIEIKTPVLAGALFGKYPHWKMSTQKIKDEMRKGWD